MARVIMGRSKWVMSALAAMLSLLCSACAPVLLKAPAGDQPVHLGPYGWEGVWLPYGGGSHLLGKFEMARVTVIDAETGRLRAEVTTEGEGGLAVTMSDLYVRKAGHWMLLSMPWPESLNSKEPSGKTSAMKGYMWGRVELNRDMLLVWAPRPDRFLELVQKGVIEGRLHEEHPEEHPEQTSDTWVEIDRLDAQTLERLQAAESMPADYWLAPVIYVRVSAYTRVGGTYGIPSNTPGPPDAQSGGP
jgi:hypothetical protein